jgi:phosphate:Na+ symporter
VGDHAVNITEIAERKISQKQSFSNAAQTEGTQLRIEINQMFDYISTALESNNIEAAKAALVNENTLNRMQVDFRRSHVKRMTDRVCTPETGLIFIDFVDNIEKIGDHLTNIAQAVIGGLQWDGVEVKKKSSAKAKKIQKQTSEDVAKSVI